MRTWDRPGVRVGPNARAESWFGQGDGVATPNLSGKTFDNYRILEPIGQGGMGVVYRAYQPSLNRYVAIKVLPPQLGHDAEFVARLQREARAAARLRHTNIVHIYSTGLAHGHHYIAMEFLEGETLGQLIKRERRLHPKRVARIVDQVARALDYAHQQGVVHRDIKPANIFVGPGDRVTLTDFGIAKAAWETGQLTRTGALMGTPEYMSPEQAETGQVDSRTDLYALGVVLYQMLVGQVPFHGTTPHVTIHQIIYEPPPPPRQLNPRITPATESVLLKALAKEPNERFQSGMSLSRSYHNALAGSGVQAPVTARKPSKASGAGGSTFRWLAIGLGLVATVLVLAVIGLLILSSRPDQQASPPAQSTRLATDTAVVRIDAEGTHAALQATERALEATAQGLGGSAATGTAAAWEQERRQATAQAAGQQATMAAATAAAEADATADAAAAAGAATQAAGRMTQEAIEAVQTAAARPTQPPPPTIPPPTPACVLQPDSQLATAWDRAWLGCPVAGANTVWAAWQPFERGYMWWRSDNDKVYVLYLQDGSNPNAGDWWLTPPGMKWDGSHPDGVGLYPPPGFREPVRGFGWLWREHLGGPTSEVGWAREEEKGFCARIQQFEQGLVFRSSTVEYCEDQLYNWATHPSFRPLYFALYGDESWRRY